MKRSSFYITIVLLLSGYLSPVLVEKTANVSHELYLKAVSHLPFYSSELAKNPSAFGDNESMGAAASLSLGRKINLNKASQKDLEYLPGLGPKTAEKIIAFRTRKGSFKRLEELMGVKGIKEKRFDKLKPFLEL